MPCDEPTDSLHVGGTTYPNLFGMLKEFECDLGDNPKPVQAALEGKEQNWL